LTNGVYITDDPNDITGCLEDALHKVIKAEPIERRLRREQPEQHGLEDYGQWVARLQAAKQVSAAEADILLQARQATMKVVAVDEFTPQQLLDLAGGAPGAGAKTGRPGPAASNTAGKRTVSKKTASKKTAVKKAVKKKAV